MAKHANTKDVAKKQTKAQKALSKELEAIYKKVAGTSLSQFTAGEIHEVMRLMSSGFGREELDTDRINWWRERVKTLEK